MVPLLFVLFCLPFYTHGITVTLDEGDVLKLASGDYADTRAQFIAIDEARSLVYVTGDSFLQVFQLANDTLTLLKTQEFPGLKLGQVRQCNNFVTFSVKPDDAEPSTLGKLRIYKVYSASTGDDLSLVNEISLGGSAGSHRHSADCQTIVVPMVNGPFEDSWDEPGSIQLIVFSRANLASQPTVTTLAFDSFEGDKDTLVANGGLFDSEVSFDQGLEPNDVCFNADESKAYVIFQSNNLIAVLDMNNGNIDSLSGLGFKDFSNVTFDPNDKNGFVEENYAIYATYSPSNIQCFNSSGTNYFIISNDGAVPYRKLIRLRELSLDPAVFPKTRFQKNKFAGRLNVWSESPDFDNNNLVDKIIVGGARSISLFNADTMTMISDTGSVFEQQINANYPGLFNSNPNFADRTVFSMFDTRSDNRGPEPHITSVFSTCRDKYFVAVVGMEMPGGLMYFTLDQSNIAAGFEYQGVLMNVITSDASATYGDLWTAGSAYTLKVSDMALLNDRNPLLLLAAKTGSTIEGYRVKVKCND